MAMVTCPKCKSTVSNTSNKCPKCGSPLSFSAFDKNAPKQVRYHMLSNIFLVVSFLLLMAEFFNLATTYVGGILLGVGFLYQGLSLQEKEKEDAPGGKKRGKLLIWISVIVMIIGVGFFILDLR